MLTRRRVFVKQIGSNHALWPSVTGKGEVPAQWPADLRAGILSMKSFLLIATRIAPSSSILTTPYCRWAQPVGPPSQRAQEKSATGERLFGLSLLAACFLLI